MVMTLSRGCGLPPNPRCGLPRSRASLITPLGGNTTDWRAGCGRSARPVRRAGECFLALSLPLSRHGLGGGRLRGLLDDVVPKHEHVHLSAQEAVDGLLGRQNDGLVLV